MKRETLCVCDVARLHITYILPLHARCIYEPKHRDLCKVLCKGSMEKKNVSISCVQMYTFRGVCVHARNYTFI